MALVLEELIFKTRTEELEKARVEIAKLGDAVNSLNKPMQDFTRSSAKTAEAIARAELAAEKARQATAKLGQENTRAAPSVDSLEKLLIKLNNTYLDMGRGFSKGEASILNQARSLGALDDQLALVEAALKNIKELNKDPFDSSLGGVRSITQEFERLTQRANLAAQGISMTTKQLGEYSRLASEARGRVVGLGMDPDSVEGQKAYNQLLSQSQKEYLDVLSVVKQLTDSEQQRLAVAKEQERLQKAASSASAARMQEWAKGVGGKSPELTSMAAFYKEQEVSAKRLTAAEDDLILREQKLAFVNKELAAGLTTASSNALFKYQKNLEAVGKSTDEITRRTTAFRAGLVEKQGHSPIRKIADDAKAAREQVDHLSRAIGTQLGDVAVSLAGGMNPFQVLIQQGDQLRFAVQNAKDEGKDLNLAMSNALKGIYTSFVDTGKVIGGFFVNAVKTTGAVITETTSDILGFTALLNYSNEKLTQFGINTGKYAKSLELIGAAFKIVAGIIGTTFIAAVVTGAVAALRLEKEQTALSQAVAKSGAVFGATAEEAVTLSKSLSDIGIGSGKATELLTEMISAGNIGKESFKDIAQAAADVESYVGIKASDSIKKFSDTIKDPVKELYEFGIQTGFVSEAQIEAVKHLQRTGEEAKAQKLAIDILKQGYIDMAESAKSNMSSLDRVLIDVKKSLSELWNSFKQSEAVASGFRTAWETVAVIVSEVWYVLVQTGKEIGGIAAQIAAIARGDISGAVSIHQQMKEDAAAARKAQDDLVASILNRSKVQQSTSAEERRQNSESLKVMQAAEKIRTEAMSSMMKLDKDRKQVLADIEVTERRRDISNTARAEMLGALKLKLAKIDEDIAKERKKDNADAISAQKKLENSYDGVMKKLAGLSNAGIASQEEYSKAQKAALDIFAMPEFQKFSTAQKIAIAQAIERAHAEEVAGKATEQGLKDYEAALADFLKIRDQADESYRQGIETAREESQLLAYQNSLIGVSSEQREHLLAVKKEDLKTQKAIQDLLAKGVNPEEQQIKDLIALGEARKANIQLLTDDQKRLQQYSKSFEDLFSKMGDAIVEFALTGKMSFGDLIKTMIADLIRFEMQLNVSNLMKGLGGFSGIATSLGFGNTSMAVSAASTMPGNSMDNLMNLTGAFGTTQAMGGAWMNGIQAFAKGGTFTNSVVSSPTLFKFAKGTGLMGEAGPEAIMPLTRSSDGSLGVRAEGTGSNVQVVINNSSGAQASASETVDSKGNRRIEVTIGEMAAAEISKSGSTSQNNIRSTFGLQPRLARR